MIKRLLVMVLPLTLLILLIHTSVYSEELSKRKFTVKVTVNGENYKDQTQSFLKRELRALNDVEVIDTDSEYELIVLVSNMKSQSGISAGIALSAVVVHKFDNKSLFPSKGFMAVAMSGGVPDATKERIVNSTNSLYYRPDLVVTYGPINGLREDCSDVVAYFDTNHLEPSRQLDKMFDGLATKYLEKKTSDDAPMPDSHVP